LIGRNVYGNNSNLSTIVYNAVLDICTFPEPPQSEENDDHGVVWLRETANRAAS
jgi:hypothetical protein